jgi:6-phosphogluconate dehydrogenase
MQIGFRSRREHTLAEKILSAIHKGFGGHVEPKGEHHEREASRN